MPVTPLRFTAFRSATQPNGVATVIGAAIQSASAIIAEFAKSDNSETDAASSRKIESTGFPSSSGSANVRQAKFLHNAINSARDNLSELMKVQTEEVKWALRKESALEAVSEVRAHAKTLERIVNHPHNESEIRIELIKSLLGPFEVRLHKLDDHPEIAPEISDLCRLNGLSSLVAAYGYLGEKATQLHEELKMAAERLQTKILDSTLRSRVLLDLDIPYRRLSFLVQIDGITELMQLVSQTPSLEGSSPLAVIPKVEKLFDLSDLNVYQMATIADSFLCHELLSELRLAEERGKNREGFLDVIDLREAYLKENEGRDA